MKLKNLIFAGVIIFMFGIQAFAFDIPKNQGYVTDLAEIINPIDEELLQSEIQEIEKTTTVEIALLTIPTTGENEIADYTFEVGQSWGVGKKSNDNGLMIVIAVDDHQWFMATGYGLEGTLPDAILKRIGEKYFPVYFRENNYGQGILKALEDINGYLIADPTVMTNYGSTTPSSTQIFQDESTWLTILIILALFLIPLKSAWVRKKPSKRLLRSLFSSLVIIFVFTIFAHWVVSIIFVIYSLITDWVDLESGGGSFGGDGGSSGSSFGGFGGGSSSGSSFGGFGGGSFGGGGAGGKW